MGRSSRTVSHGVDLDDDDHTHDGGGHDGADADRGKRDGDDSPPRGRSGGGSKEPAAGGHGCGPAALLRAVRDAASWWRELKEDFGEQFVTVVVLVYFIQGIKSFPALGQTYYYKEHLMTDGALLEPTAIQALVSVARIPWNIKPLWGLTTDSLPLFGYRRKSYLMLMGGLGTVGWLLLGLFDWSPSLATWLILLTNLSTAFADVVSDAMVAERAKRAGGGNRAADLQSACWAALAVGGMIGAAMGGWTLDLISPMSDSTGKIDRGAGAQRAFLIFSVSSMGLVYLGHVLEEAKLEGEDARFSGAKVVRQLKLLKLTLSQPVILKAAAFIFLAKGLVPGFYTITQVYKIDVLNFSSTLLGFTDVIAYLGVLLGVVVYNKYLKATPFRKVFTIVSLGLAFVYCFDVILFTHSNRLLFGGDCAPVDNNPQEVACTSDKFFSISDEAISNAADQLKAMPVLVLAARICPKSIEGTLFATLMSLSNLGWDSSQYVGAIVASQIGIKKVSYACEGCVSGGPDPRSYGTDGVWRTGNRGRYVGPSPAPGYLFTEDFSRPNALDDWKGNDRLRGGKTTATIVDDPLKGECPGVKCRNRVLKQNRCVYEGETFSKSTVSCTKAKPCLVSYWVLQNAGLTAFQGFSSEFAGHHTWTGSYTKNFEGTVTDGGWIKDTGKWSFQCFVFPDCEFTVGGKKNSCESHKWVAGSDTADGTSNFAGGKCEVSCAGKPASCKLCQDPSLKMEHGEHHVHFMIEGSGGGAKCNANYWDDFAVQLAPMDGAKPDKKEVAARCSGVKLNPSTPLKPTGGFNMVAGMRATKPGLNMCAKDPTCLPDPTAYGSDGEWSRGNYGRFKGPTPPPGFLFADDFQRPNALDDWKGNDRLHGGKTTATIVDDPKGGFCPGPLCRGKVLKQNRCVYEGETFSKSTVSCTKAKPCIASFWILQNKGNTAFQGFSSEFAGHHTWTASYQKGFEGTVTDQGWIQKGTDWQFMCFVFPDCEYGGSKNACESHKWVAGSDSADGSNNFDGSKCSVSCTGKPVGCKLCQDPSLKMEHGQHHVHFMIEANGGGADACKSNYWDDFAVVLSPSTTTDSSVRAKCAELKKLGGFKGIVPSKRRPQLCASGALSRLPFLTGSGTKCGGKNAKGKAFIDTNSCPFCTGSVLDYADADPDKIWEKKNTDGSFMVMATQGKSRITVDPVLAYKWASEAQLATRWKKDYAPIEENLWIGAVLKVLVATFWPLLLIQYLVPREDPDLIIEEFDRRVVEMLGEAPGGVEMEGRGGGGGGSSGHARFEDEDDDDGGDFDDYDARGSGRGDEHDRRREDRGREHFEDELGRDDRGERFEAEFEDDF